jgi:hypothetical protein
LGQGDFSDFRQEAAFWEKLCLLPFKLFALI